jgi:hypothetical protein
MSAFFKQMAFVLLMSIGATLIVVAVVRRAQHQYQDSRDETRLTRCYAREQAQVAGWQHCQQQQRAAEQQVAVLKDQVAALQQQIAKLTKRSHQSYSYQRRFDR